MIEELNKTIRNILKDNIDDPLNRGVNWIFIDYPKRKERTPLISIRQVGMSRDYIGIGHTGHRFTIDYTIETWNTSTDEFTSNGERYAASRLRDWLGDQVITCLISNRNNNSLRNLGVQDLLITSMTNRPYDPSTDLYVKEITISLIVDKEP